MTRFTHDPDEAVAAIGDGATVMIGGIACLGAAGWFYSRLPEIRALVRPIYVRLGIIPEVATGLQTATELRPKA